MVFFPLQFSRFWSHNGPPQAAGAHEGGGGAVVHPGGVPCGAVCLRGGAAALAHGAGRCVDRKTMEINRKTLSTLRENNE